MCRKFYVLCLPCRGLAAINGKACIERRFGSSLHMQGARFNFNFLNKSKRSNLPLKIIFHDKFYILFISDKKFLINIIKKFERA